jgi:hypothetical protein
MFEYFDSLSKNEAALHSLRRTGVVSLSSLSAISNTDVSTLSLPSDLKDTIVGVRDGSIMLVTKDGVVSGQETWARWRDILGDLFFYFEYFEEDGDGRESTWAMVRQHPHNKRLPDAQRRRMAMEYCFYDFKSGIRRGEILLPLGASHDPLPAFNYLSISQMAYHTRTRLEHNLRLMDSLEEEDEEEREEEEEELSLGEPGAGKSKFAFDAIDEGEGGEGDVDGDGEGDRDGEGDGPIGRGDCDGQQQDDGMQEGAVGRSGESNPYVTHEDSDGGISRSAKKQTLTSLSKMKHFQTFDQFSADHSQRKNPFDVTQSESPSSSSSSSNQLTFESPSLHPSSAPTFSLPRSPTSDNISSTLAGLTAAIKMGGQSMRLSSSNSAISVNESPFMEGDVIIRLFGMKDKDGFFTKGNVLVHDVSNGLPKEKKRSILHPVASAAKSTLRIVGTTSGIASGIQCHAGFWSIWERIRKQHVELFGCDIIEHIHKSLDPKHPNGRIVLVGHSMGACLTCIAAYQLACRYPHLLPRICIVNFGAPLFARKVCFGEDESSVDV